MKDLAFLPEPICFNEKFDEFFQDNLESTLQYFESIAVADKLANKKIGNVLVNRKNRNWDIKFNDNNNYLSLKGFQYYPVQLELTSIVAVTVEFTRHLSNFSSINSENIIQFQLNNILDSLIRNYPISLKLRSFSIDRIANPYNLSLNFHLNLAVVVQEALDVDVVNHLRSHFAPMINKEFYRLMESYFYCNGG